MAGLRSQTRLTITKEKMRLSLSRSATVQGVPRPLPKVLPLPLQDVTNRRRFAEPVDSTILDKASKGVVPEKTEASTQWAVKNFESLVRNRSSSASEIQVFCIPMIPN